MFCVSFFTITINFNVVDQVVVYHNNGPYNGAKQLICLLLLIHRHAAN